MQLMFRCLFNFIFAIKSKIIRRKEKNLDIAVSVGLVP